MENRINEMLAYFEHQIAECGKKEKKLQCDYRTDEANLEKIKANVYDIFKTMFSMAVKAAQSKDNKRDSIRSKFMEKVRGIPINWRRSYDCAKEHQDSSKIMIEEIKLQTVAAIESTFEEIWGVEQ